MRALVVALGVAVAVLVAMVALPPPAWALAPDRPLARCSVDLWRSRDGLPGDAIQALAQGADGALWIATLGGVARYDGRRFTTLEAQPPLRAALSETTTLLATRDGDLYLASLHRDPLRVHLGVVTALDAIAGRARPDRARAWAEDVRGQVWAANATALFQGSGGGFVAQRLAALEGRQPTAIHVDGRGTPWLGTDRGLFKVAGERLEPVSGLPPSIAVSALHEDRRRVLWIAAGDRLWSLQEDGTLAPAPALGIGPIVALADDEDGHLWVGGAAGLVRLQGGRLDRFGVADGLPEAAVTALLVDREGGLWVGTANRGLARFSDRTLDTAAVPPALAGLELESIAEDDQGALWFAARGRGAYRWKDGHGTWLGAKEGVPSEAIRAVLPGEPGEVWMGTARGLVRWRGGKVVDPGLWAREVVVLYRDRGGVLWVGGDGALGRIERGQITVFSPKEGLPAGQLRAIGEDPGGALWVSAVGGLVRFEDGRFVPAFVQASRKLGGVRSMWSDADGTFWLTTAGSGLVRIKAGKAFFFDAAVGLEGDMLYQLLADDAGDLWFGTHNAIVRVTRASLDAVASGWRPAVELVSYEATDRRAGVVAAKVRQPAAWKARDGRLWFLTQQGPVTVDPRRARPIRVPPGVIIETAIIDGHTLPLDAEAELPPGRGNLQLEFAAITLGQAAKARYRYRLEGHDEGWIEGGRKATVTYAGLPPGAYRFRVQASNGDGFWNERGATLAFSLTPPVHRRAWFYGACAALGAALLLVAHKLRVARVRGRYALLFAERTRVARELHDTLLQGMSSASLQLGALRHRLAEAPEEQRRDLELVQETVTQCLEDTRQAVSGLRARDRDDGELGAALGRLARRLGGAHQVACAVTVDGAPVGLSHAVEDELYRIGQEALANALKHARPRKVDLHLRYRQSEVTLTITDDGAGFDPDRAPQDDEPGASHFGLVGLKERAQRIGAQLEIHSKPGEGTRVEVVAPITRRTEQLWAVEREPPA